MINIYRKLFSIIMIVILVLGLASCFNEGEQEPEEPVEAKTLKVVMVASEGGLGDQSFNDMAYDGVLRASGDFDIETSVLEPATTEEYINSISEAALNGADMVIAAGVLQEDTMVEIAEQYPETSFVVVDSDKEGPKNVMSLSYKDQEGSFLVGIIAALTTDTNIVGFIGGREDPNIDKFEYGYRAGVKAINPEAQVLVEYTGCFDDPSAGRDAALLQIEEGVDVIFHASGECGIGVIQAAGEKDIWAIGVDKDQSSLDPDAVLCTMFKRVDHGIYLAIQTLAEDNFNGGVYEFGLDFEAVGYTDEAGNLPNDIRQKADEYAAAILSGDIYVPKDRAEFEGFHVPEEGLL